MLQLPGKPLLDKAGLIGGCVRLRLEVDADRLRAEVARLPPSMWSSSGGRVGVHQATRGIFLRGYAPAEGNLPIDDRPVLQALPYVQEVIRHRISPMPQRCLLARLLPRAAIAVHVDRAPYFSQTLRVHIPVETQDQARILCDGLEYRMRPGEVWVLNNSIAHGARNEHPSLSRTHLICDFLGTPELIELLSAGERDLACREAAGSIPP